MVGALSVVGARSLILVQAYPKNGRRIIASHPTSKLNNTLEILKTDIIPLIEEYNKRIKEVILLLEEYNKDIKNVIRLIEDTSLSSTL